MLKKLLYVVEAFAGGVFTYMVDLTSKLVDDYDIYIVYSIRSETPDNFEDYFDQRINFIYIESLLRAVNPIKDLKAFNEIKKTAKQVNPDIIHLHSTKAGVIGRIAFRKSKAKLFYTPHGYSFLMEDQSAAKRFIYKSIEKLCAFNNSTTISCSKGEHEETISFNNNAEYISNGIDTDELAALIQENNGISDTKYLVATSGRICMQKNPELFNKLAENYPQHQFLWIGSGNMKDKLTSDNITITGWITRKEVIKYMKQAENFLLTSLWEGLPIALLEAMYMKKVCIVSNTVGNRDVIRNEGNGFLCDSFEQYCIALDKVISSDCCTLAEKAHEDIMSTYNINVMANQYKKIYEN